MHGIDCTLCPSLCESRSRIVWGSGDPETAWLFVIAEAPGETEDQVGIPLIGRSGDLIRKTLGMAGLSLDRDVYFTNAVRCRPTKNRNPTKEEISNCQKWLFSEYSMVAPTSVLVLGKIADEAFTSMATTYNVEMPVQTRQVYHPAYILRQPRFRESWERDVIDFVKGTYTKEGQFQSWSYGRPEGNLIAVDTEFDVEDQDHSVPISYQISDGERALFITFEDQFKEWDVVKGG